MPILDLPQRIKQLLPGMSRNTSSTATGSTMSMASLECSIVYLETVCSAFRLKCSHCNTSMGPLLDDAESLVKTWLAGNKTIPPTTQLSTLECPTCGCFTCVGCGKEPVLSKTNIWTAQGVANHCCEMGQLFGLWLLLYRFEDEDTAFNLSNTSVPKPKAPTKKRSKSLGPWGVNAPPGLLNGHGGSSAFTEDVGVGYAMQAYDGYGDLDIDTEDEALYVARHSLRSAATNEPVENLDSSWTAMFQMLRGSLSDNDATSLRPDLALFQTNIMMTRVIELARNDSIGDLTDRYQLYQAMFELVQDMIKRPALVPLFCEDRAIMSGAQSFRELSQTVTKKNNRKIASDSFGPSFVTSLNNTYRQSKIYLQRQTKIKQLLSEQSAQMRKSMEICTSVVAIYEQLKQHIPMEEDHTSPDLWASFAQSNKLTFSDDILANHRGFMSQRGRVPSNATARGRMNTIGKEIAVMATSLPDGIFLKVAESRSDVMKVLIVGVEGTPYAGGLFTFDLFLDENYPATPPKMYFVLENCDNDGQPMNPNLHIGGTVCLSLLNTWEGSPAEMWQPHKSTVLSVLVSVQAMILGAPIPWINEPGFERASDSPSALAHKYRIQCKTVNYAINAWLEPCLQNTGKHIWQDLAEKYFKSNGEKILTTVHEWADENRELLHYNPAAPAIVHNNYPPTTKKSKGKIKAPAGGEDLVAKLDSLLNAGEIAIRTKRKPNDEADSPTSSAKPKRQKAKTSDHPVDSAPGPSNWSVNALKPLDERWRYTGDRSLKVVRDACAEMNLQPAKGVQKSIDRLEEHVNVNGLMYGPVAERWGEMRHVDSTDDEV